MSADRTPAQLGRTLVATNRRRTGMFTCYQPIPLSEREEMLRGFGYSPDAARQIAWVSRYLTAFNFGNEFFDYRRAK